MHLEILSLCCMLQWNGTPLVLPDSLWSNTCLSFCDMLFLDSPVFPTIHATLD